MSNQDLRLLRDRYHDHTPTLLGPHREYAVLCPFVERPDGLHLIFEVRSSNVSQAGEVCFPGGQIEPGETPEACALRETREELSIPASEIQIFGTGDFICNQRNFLLRPILGLVTSEGFDGIVPSPAEVSEVFTVPLQFFRETMPELWNYELIPQVPIGFPYEKVGIPQSYAWNHGRVDLPIWYYEGHTVWGMTARIVRDLVEALK